MAIIRKPKNALKFARPASWWGSTWREALPTGNGKIGAAVYGGAAGDVIMINHADLWWQGYVGVLQDVADKLKDVRKKMDDGQPKDAENILSNALITKGYRPKLSYPLPLCDLKVKMPIDRQPKEYSRIINMENGEVTVSFKDGATKYERSVFVSRAKDLIAYEIIKAGPKAIDIEFSLDVHDKFNVRTPSGVSKTPEGVNVKYENYFMYFSARSDNSTDFGVVARINHYGGTQSVTPNGIRISGADKVLVFLAPFIESQREKEWKALKASLTAEKSTYEKLMKEHSPLHAKLYNSADIDLGADQRDEFVDTLITSSFQNGSVPPALIEKLWAYGRYLMICGTSAASAPLAPYGLWCGDFKGVDSQIRADGSLQTIYSHAFAGNLTEFFGSVFTYYESVIDELKRNSSRIYGCRGIMIPSLIAHGSGLFGTVDSGVLHFTGAGGWISQLFYDYYRFTGDVKFLKDRALPFMKEVATFYEEFLKVGSDNMYESCPSYSPNTTPANFSNNGVDKFEIARSATIDFAIAREFFTNLIEGAGIAGKYKDEVPKWKDMLTRMPTYKMNDDGSVKEYLDEKFADNYTSASTSVYYPVFPGTETCADAPELVKAFDTTAKKKLAGSSDEQTSMSLSRYANVFARLGNGDSALEIISHILRYMTMNNLITVSGDWRGMSTGTADTWATYSIEGNMGISSAIQEMLVQSDSDTVRILPALPSGMEKGETSGMLTRTGVEIQSLSWDMKKSVIQLKVKASKAKKINLVVPFAIKRYKGTATDKVDGENGKVEISLPSGKAISIDIRI